MSPDQALRELGTQEEELEAACTALASLLRAQDQLEVIAAEHCASAHRLLGYRPRRRVLLTSMHATMVALVRDESRALAWLREREHDLVRGYLSLVSRSDISDELRATLRQFLVPAAFDRFAQVDKLVLAEESISAPLGTG